MANSKYCLPMVFFNLGGEMLYVLDQRLKAQNILSDKASKVLCDIASQMTEEKCLEEIFSPQKLPGKAAIRSLFDRLAHASIMRLNTSSMDKLYDLMIMAFKYQVVLCKAPEDLMLVTLNHLDTMRDMVTSSEQLVAAINDIHRRLRGFYKDMTNGEFMYIRHTLLYFFQDIRKRVSILLRDKAQLSDGHFVMPVGGPVSCGADVPGTIRYMNNGVVTKTSTFLPTLPFIAADDAGSLELLGDRVTNLGTNLYSIRKELDTSVESFANTPAYPPPDIGGDPSAVKEFNLLAHLVRSSKSSSADTFKLSLFNDDDDDDDDDEATVGSASYTSKVVHIDAKKSDTHLQSLIKDFSDVNTDQQKDDILDLLDQASS